MAGEAAAGASDRALAMYAAFARGASASAPRGMGPGLVAGMTEAETIERLNAWGSALDGDVRDLGGNLAQTQAVVGTTFEQARATLMGIVDAFRTEAEAMRQHGIYEATQNVSRLEFVVSEARGRFDLQEARFTQGLGDLSLRQQAFEAWAQAEPARVAAFVQAAPAPAAAQGRAAASPGGTVSFYPSPGPAGGTHLPPAPEACGFTTPPQRPTTQPDAAWSAWAAGRQQPPQFDAWAGAARAAQQQPPPQQQPFGEPRHSLSGAGGDGGKPREMRLEARNWGNNQPKLDVGMLVDGFQIWKDRATMFLSRERPDVRKLLAWAEPSMMGSR